MPASLYHVVFLYTIIFLTIIVCVQDSPKNYLQIKQDKGNTLITFIFCMLLAVWIGHRPISGFYFGDTSSYAHTYNLMQQDFIPDDEGEWVWTQFMFYCSQVMDVSSFFTLVDIGYFGFMLWGCHKLMPNASWTAMLFCMGAFSFFTYSTNGIRNGLACSIVITVLAFAKGNNIQRLIALLLAYIAYNIHHSTSLPILMGVAALLFVRSFKAAYRFWIISILISLVAGSVLTEFFAGLGFDDRLSYLDTEMDSETFSHTGFRFDFLIYSMMPIILGYYVIYKRGIRNATYEFLLNTYTLSNAFWVMVIRASYSNRFAYLSWFLYPIVLAYPLLEMDIWENRQGNMLAKIMMAQVGFTWFMSTIY